MNRWTTYRRSHWRATFEKRTEEINYNLISGHPSPQGRNMLTVSSYVFPQYRKICMIVHIKRKKQAFRNVKYLFQNPRGDVPSLTVTSDRLTGYISSSHTSFQRGVSPCFKTRGVCSLRRGKRRKFYRGSSQLASQTDAPKRSQQQSSVMPSVWGELGRQP